MIAPFVGAAILLLLVDLSFAWLSRGGDHTSAWPVQAGFDLRVALGGADSCSLRANRLDGAAMQTLLSSQ